MNNKVTGFFGKLKSIFTKDQVEVDMDRHIYNLKTLSEIDAKYHRAIGEIAGYSPKSRKITTLFYAEFNKANRFSKIPISKEIFLDLSTLLKTCSENSTFILSLLGKMRGNTIVKEGMSYREINALRAVPHMSFVVDFGMLMSNYVIACELELAGGPKEDFLKPEIERLNKDMKAFAAILASYGVPPREFKERFANLSENLVSDDLNERVSSVNDLNVDETDFVPFLPDGFIGSPIYTIGSIFATWSVAKYQRLQDEQATLKLRLNYYESLRDGGEPNPEVEKEIEYLQDRVNTNARKIEKMEKNVL